jgi:hypothetical protein
MPWPRGKKRVAKAKEPVARVDWRAAANAPIEFSPWERCQVCGAPMTSAMRGGRLIFYCSECTGGRTL